MMFALAKKMVYVEDFVTLVKKADCVNKVKKEGKNQAKSFI